MDLGLEPPQGARRQAKSTLPLWGRNSPHSPRLYVGNELLFGDKGWGFYPDGFPLISDSWIHKGAGIGPIRSYGVFLKHAWPFRWTAGHWWVLNTIAITLFFQSISNELWSYPSLKQTQSDNKPASSLVELIHISLKKEHDCLHKEIMFNNLSGFPIHDNQVLQSSSIGNVYCTDQPTPPTSGISRC